ncbi:MAG: isochorismatase family protein [Pseudomonadota bacterium]
MAEHEDAGYGAVPVGFGQRAAVLVVDFQKGFTQPEYELGKSEHVARAVANTAKLLEVARPRGLPVAKCYTAYESKRDIPYWKVEVLYKDFFYGHPSTEIDERVHDPEHDFTFCKTAPSIFFETPLKTFLIKHQVDTVIITGCTTSGCIRASIIDAFSNGYRVIVPEDCCGDMAEGPHHDNLRDVGRRYADVVTLEEVITRLAGS